MILANHGIVSSSGNTDVIINDTDALAFITAASITDNTQKTAINTLVTDLKTYNIWVKMKALYPFVGGTATSHKFNLKDPRDLDAAYRLTFNGGWTHSSTGALPNGTTAYANTYLSPSLTQNIYSNGFGFYTRTLNTSASSDSAPMGSYVLQNQCSTFSYANSNTVINSRLNDALISSSSIVPTGLLSTQRTSLTDTKLYKNSTNVGSGNSGGSLPNISFYFGTLNINSIPYTSGYVNNDFCLVYVSDGLDSTDVTNLYAAVQSFQTSLNRQV